MAIIDRRGIVITVNGITEDSDIEPSAGLAIKQACRAATTASILLNGEQTIDGIAVVAGDRVLVKDQADATQNGIYVVSTGNWLRSADFNKTGEVAQGTQVLVDFGDISAALGYFVTTANPIIIDETGIAFASLGNAGDQRLFDTIADASAEEIFDENFIFVSGYAAAGDGGAAVYKRVNSEPSHAGKIHSADGAWWELSDPRPNVLQFGAKGDNSTDNTTAINNALAAFTTIYFPAGKYCHSGSILLARADANYIKGSGPASTFLINTGSAISIQATMPPTEYGVSALTMTRTGTPTGFSYGIYTGTNITNHALFENLVVEKNDGNLFLGPCVWGKVQNVVTQYAKSTANITLQNTAASGLLQWELSDILAQLGDNHGLLVQGVAGPTNVTLGNWSRITTYAHTGFGIACVGVSGGAINNIRANQLFLGSDGAGALYLDTYATAQGAHIFDTLNVELVGLVNTGSAGTTPAPNTGSGVVMTANNGAVLINNAWVHACAYNGIRSDASSFQLSNSIVLNNGQAVSAGNRKGIWIVSGSAKLSNVTSANTAGTAQDNGITLDTSSSGSVLENIDLSFGSGNSSANLTINSTSGNLIWGVKGNNLSGMTAAANVGTSPATITAGPMRETHYLKQSATNTATVAKGGQQIHALAGSTTYYPIELGPNESYTVTWATTQPTYTKNVH